MTRLCSLCPTPIRQRSTSGLCRSCGQEHKWQTKAIRGSKLLIEALRKAGYA